MFRTVIGGIPRESTFFLVKSYLRAGPAEAASSVASIPGLQKIRFLEGGFAFVAKLKLAS